MTISDGRQAPAIAELNGRDSGSADFEGRDHGSTVSFITVSTDEVGAGPRLHQHPYDETFHIRSGAAEFVVGTERLVGRAGQVLVVPPYTPHKFSNLGEGRLEMVNIHASDHFVTEWLET